MLVCIGCSMREVRARVCRFTCTLGAFTAIFSAAFFIIVRARIPSLSLFLSLSLSLSLSPSSFASSRFLPFIYLLLHFCRPILAPRFARLRGWIGWSRRENSRLSEVTSPPADDFLRLFELLWFNEGYKMHPRSADPPTTIRFYDSTIEFTRVLTFHSAHLSYFAPDNASLGPQADRQVGRWSEHQQHCGRASRLIAACEISRISRANTSSIPLVARARVRGIDRFHRWEVQREGFAKGGSSAVRCPQAAALCRPEEQGRHLRRGERLRFLGWTSLDEYASPSAMRIAGPPLILALSIALSAILADGPRRVSLLVIDDRRDSLRDSLRDSAILRCKDEAGFVNASFELGAASALMNCVVKCFLWFQVESPRVISI